MAKQVIGYVGRDQEWQLQDWDKSGADDCGAAMGLGAIYWLSAKH